MPEIKYDKLCEQLERMIRNGTFGNKLPGIHTLAKQLDANHITVRKALELLIDRGLLEVIPSRGTFVREQERAVRNFHVIGCIGSGRISQVGEIVFNQMNDQLEKTGYKILDITASSRIFRDNPRLLLQFPVDGYIFFGSSMNRKIMELLQGHHIPSISTVNSNFPEINHVGMDYTSGYTQAVKMLKQRGCRRIAFMDYQRQPDFRNYIENIRSVFIRELGSAFEPELFSIYDAQQFFIRYGELYHKAVAEECIRSWHSKIPDGLVSFPEAVPVVKQFSPEIKTAAFASYGFLCNDSDISLTVNLPRLLESGSRRMLEILAGDKSITEIRIPYIIREKPCRERGIQ